MSYRAAPIIPPDLITYRLGSKYVYVGPASTYEEAVDVAQKEFSEELGHIPRDRIAFTVSVKTSCGDQRTVRISESAWMPAVARLLRGDIIDIEVRRGAQLSDGKEEPPQYLEVPSSNSSAPSRSQSRSPSPTPSRKSEKGASCRLKFWDKSKDS